MLKKTILYRLTIFLFTLINSSVFAQETNVEMADTMRNNGKIYVVVAVVVTIFAGITLYLINAEKKINRLANEINSDSDK